MVLYPFPTLKMIVDTSPHSHTLPFIVYHHKRVLSSAGCIDWRFAINTVRQLFLEQLLGGLCMCVLELQRIWGSVF